MILDDGQKILFSDYFDAVDKPLIEALEEYGAFNVSLLSDIPLFIDPFLLFNSDEKIYQDLHNEIIRYLTFLRDKSVSKSVTSGLLDAWYRFTEVKQTWLGFTAGGNQGRGLGPKFAHALDANFARLFSDNNEQITAGKHLEKLCLIGSGVGKDSISDFTTNLIAGYLAHYTQEFAKQYLKPEQCAKFYVPKARFNYYTEVWEQLPFNDLYYYLTNQPPYVPKPLGPVRMRPPRST